MAIENNQLSLFQVEKVIDKCNKAGNSTEFIKFILEMINETIDETSKITTQEKILNLIKKNPSITQTQIATALGLTRDGISYNIKQLKDKGIIKRFGATKNGQWIICN